MVELVCRNCAYTRPDIAEGRAFIEHAVRNDQTGEYELAGLICYACLPDDFVNTLRGRLEQEQSLSVINGQALRPGSNIRIQASGEYDDVSRITVTEKEGDWCGNVNCNCES